MAETPLLYEYFFGKELSFALGFNLSFSRLGSAANDVLTYNFYEANGVVFAMSMGAFVLMPFCFILLCLLLCYRKYFEKTNKRHNIKSFDAAKSDIDMTTKLMIAAKDGGYDSTQQQGFTERDMSVKWDTSMASKYDYSMSQQQQLDEQDEFNISSDIDDGDSDIEIEPDTKFQCSQLRQFDTRYWLLVINCCFQYGAVVPWMKIGGSYMQVKYGYDHEKANRYLTIPYIVAAIVTPIIGFAVDKLGKRCQLLLIACVILTLSHYTLGWISPDQIGMDANEDVLPLTGLIGLGLGYSVFCAVIWPSFAVVIPPNLIGTGYGIPTSAYNLVLGLFFLAVGILTREDEDLEDVSIEKYTDVEWFLLSTCLCSIVTLLMLWHSDRTMGDMLNLPAAQQLQKIKLSMTSFA